ncbi:MAG: hypothetical protein A3E87_08545 [Gammaproteobacteria bacterium RIFCSPHIGHO2_12_FULL_35_23]|nr:MAG: hypothetical protein A3E87_08545 [Gammaproteobacteria bacterium RIFCSPHIGHO2_12_FULL_35_23]
MNKLLIKICGLTCPTIAEKTALLGANFIGLVFYRYSKRYVEPSQALEISLAAKAGGAQVVAVVVEQTIHEIEALCQTLAISIVQLHGDKAKLTANQLPQSLSKIMALTPQEKFSLSQSVYFNPKQDYLLFDNNQPGSGRRFNEDQFIPVSQRFFLAGGLTSDNIKLLIERYHPFGVDVSTGVEKVPGVKDLQLIKTFIERVKTC